MSALAVGVLRETLAGERRVALVPDSVTSLQKLGVEVLVEAGAGTGAWFPDAAYAAVGARLVDRLTLYAESDVLTCLHPPVDRSGLRPDQVLLGLLHPQLDPVLAQELAEAKVTALSLDGLPRTLSRAQSMDALTSQANVAGYKAALVAADAYGGYFPMLMTAAGTIRPARVLVLGAGVAGLQAIGTARRLGAIVTGYDVRDEARADVASMGAAFLDLTAAVSATGEGGYARQLTDDEQRSQQAAMASAVATFDVVITTAQVPGRRPPVLISAEAVAMMRPGSVLVDLAASRLGGNVEGSVPDSSIVVGTGVTLIGAGNLPAAVPQAASTAFARNIAALLAHLLRDGKLVLDRTDEITAGVLITTDGEIVHPAVLAAAAQLEKGTLP
jgi:NAD(P) transhydrogenase subunit alpha